MVSVGDINSTSVLVVLINVFLDGIGAAGAGGGRGGASEGTGWPDRTCPVCGSLFLPVTYD